ncbi:hypothetical protein QWY82_07145 [Simiduia curdlanivorans]|uniref:Uncharacterized protein n=1 Tax=Simiduia curdlanivorans TaxID=1492769 RepID=A0ABV8V7I2_9GAMM|nr:hypothetical protein [Simiduia curdlanivorans]MDN3638577.1 hypothetical protein [Simiduia curdlanivorans]
MQRLYYLTKTLQAAEHVTSDLLNHGLFKHQLHLIAKNDGELEQHHLPTASPLETTDILPAGEGGLVIGLVVGACACLGLYAYGLDIKTYWMAYVGLMVLCTSFFTWLGGFIGIGLRHYKLGMFKDELDAGSILVMVDTPTERRTAVESLMAHHPDAVAAGSGSTWNNPLHPAHL